MTKIIKETSDFVYLITFWNNEYIARQYSLKYHADVYSEPADSYQEARNIIKNIAK